MAFKREMSLDEQLSRREALQEVRETFPYTEEGFLLFAQVCINSLIQGKPDLNRVQADMCRYLMSGPTYRMLQAQRGQAKTTLASIFAVFTLIHKPWFRILIVSAAGKLSKEIAYFIIQILYGLDILWMLRADSQAGDRESMEAYDVHWLFKGTNKSPSIKCMGIDSSLAGTRADMIIPDDVESMKNSKTDITRAQLEELTKEFEAVNADGEIVYLGTPQGLNSIYNNLEARGYEVRIWSGRYPTFEEEMAYDGRLAPMLKLDMVRDPSLREGGGFNGKSGKPTCPEMFNEEKLLTKELSLGKAKFLLQYMLNTRLMDRSKYPLKLEDLVVTDFSSDAGPVLPIWSNALTNLYTSTTTGTKFRLFRPVPMMYEMRKFDQAVMYIDPAGGGKNGDELAYAVIKLIGAYVYACEISGLPGGYEEWKLEALVKVAKKWGVKTVAIEKNYGHGAHANAIKPIFSKLKWPVEIEEVYESGQKELRIIDVLEPLVESHRLIMSSHAVEYDAKTIVAYPTELRATYRFLHQFSMISIERGCLRHEDRLDALAGAVRVVIEKLDFDTQIMMEAIRRKEALERFRIWGDRDLRRHHLAGTRPPGIRNAFNALVGKVKRPARAKKRNRFS